MSDTKKKFSCSNCTYSNDNKQNTLSHINHKCKDAKVKTNENILFHCSYCNKGFATMTHVPRHEQTCKVKKSYVDEEENKILREENARLKEENIDLKNHAISEFLKVEVEILKNTIELLKIENKKLKSNTITYNLPNTKDYKLEDFYNKDVFYLFYLDNDLETKNTYYKFGKSSNIKQRSEDLRILSTDIKLVYCLELSSFQLAGKIENSFKKFAKDHKLNANYNKSNCTEIIKTNNISNVISTVQLIYENHI